MITYQDFIKEASESGYKAAIINAVNDWKSGRIYKTAVIADKYDRQENDTIMNYVKKLFSLTGMEIQDFTASNNKIASNFFHRLNTQRNTYSLGNGVTFSKSDIKGKFGKKFDTKLYNAAYKALIHGVTFPLWNGEVNCFEVTEFRPLWCEETGILMAGIRFWQIDEKKPTFFTLYEADGYTVYKLDGADWYTVKEKSKYVVTMRYTEAEGASIEGEYNYSALPIIPLWGGKLKQSTLVGLQSQIDSYDLIRSGFANDLTDVAQIYWILENYGGMDNADLMKFRDRLKLLHIAEADTSEGGKITPYTQEIPYQARQAYLDSIRKEMYDGFGALDVHTITAGATNDHIDAAYQPMDENADDFEMQIIEFVQALGLLIGLDEDDCVPIFKRNRISNQKEQVEMLIMEEPHLDDYTFLSKLPNVSPDEVEEIMKRKSAEDIDRFMGAEEETTENIGGG